MQYCSLQHWVLFPVTSTIGCCFCFGSMSSFFLELFLHWSPVAYWALTDLGSSRSEFQYSTFKVKTGGCEEIPHVQGKRNPNETVGVVRGHQRADRQKPQSQKTTLITWTTDLSRSRKLWTMPCRATQDRLVLVESSHKMWSTGERNVKSLQYSCLENPMNCMKRQKDRAWEMNCPGR